MSHLSRSLCAMLSLWCMSFVACQELPDDVLVDAGMVAGEEMGESGSDPVDMPDDALPDVVADAARDASVVVDIPLDAAPTRPTRLLLDFERMQRGRESHDGRYVAMHAFGPDEEASVRTSAPLNVTLTLSPAVASIGVRRDDGERGQIDGVARPPEISIELAHRPVDGALIPAMRGFTAHTEHDVWWAMVGAGISWSEPDDLGSSRATLPLTLVEPHANCSFHGVVTWLYDVDQGVFSDAYYQVSQETCLYFKADFWGWLEVSTSPLADGRATEILDDFAREEAAKLPVQHIEKIEEDFGVDTSQFFQALNPQHVTAYGVSWQGVHYRGECATRQGDHPLCGQVVLPSYSTAKSAVAGMTYMAMRRDDVNVGSAAMGDLLTGLPEHWQGVTLDDLLDMRSGHYDSVLYMADEDGARMFSFFLARGDEDRSQAALDFPEQPGQAPWVYHTSDTFLASRMMQAVLGEDMFEWLVARVFTPLNLSLAARSAHLRTTANEGTSQHFGGYGSFWLPGDVVLLAEGLHAHARGERDDVFDVAMVGEVMQRGDASHGVEASPGVWYHRGFWGLEVDESMGFPCRRVIPFMSGFGGITVALLPNGATYYVFKDDAEFEWLGAAVELAKLGDFCS